MIRLFADLPKKLDSASRWEMGLSPGSNLYGFLQRSFPKELASLYCRSSVLFNWNVGHCCGVTSRLRKRCSEAAFLVRQCMATDVKIKKGLPFCTPPTPYHLSFALGLIILKGGYLKRCPRRHILRPRASIPTEGALWILLQSGELSMLMQPLARTYLGAQRSQRPVNAPTICWTWQLLVQPFMIVRLCSRMKASFFRLIKPHKFCWVKEECFVWTTGRLKIFRNN